ncbi:ATP-dependent RecD-like DNA helicase [Acetonema longum]|uniref:ATP-dependent RecD2 DNA helicase n=1 Tax=Acetonema longum DSM 6540 TaxID=1009370 RepID=F7NNT8_9FIRM|nr:ATP-dependent RecD-like DNA helicase [Acetonema longum]EGO62272.1 helicase, RecD/TraA family protein [Acetonema longum DSM 6540]
MELLTGTVETITYQNQDNAFIVFKLQPRGQKNLVPVVGYFAAPLLGEEVELTGEWVEHPRFGRQFKAASFKRIQPTSLAGIERYLGSGAIKGIGPAMAGRLVKKFGAETLTVIELFPHRLVEVEGIGQKKADQICQSYAEQDEMREIMLFLETHGVSGAYAAKLYACYGGQVVAILQQNPYRLAEEVEGIGFRKADQIARSLGFDANHPERLAAGIQFALLQTAQAGHCCVPESALVEEAAKLLAAELAEVSLILQHLIREEKLCREDFHGTTLLYPRHLFYAERRVADRLLRLRDRAKPVSAGDHQEIVAEWEAGARISLAQAQREALAAALAHGVLVLTGGPGTGKTTTVQGILAVLEQQGFKILLGAPTGRAAKRLAETTGREAVTVHRMLESTGGLEGAPLFTRDEENPLDADVVILDEVSMMDILLTHYFLKAVPDGCRVVLVGDVDQLPAVGPGSVLKDIIRSKVLPVVRLTEVFRQANESIIVQNAHRINRGQPPDCGKNADFQFHQIESAEQVAAAILRLVKQDLAAEGFNPQRDVQVLSPMHRQVCGVENLNKQLQAALNPPKEPDLTVTGVAQVFRSGDKVMQMRNNYEKNVFNGDIGFIAEIDTNRIVVRYPDNDVPYERSDFDQLQLAYCLSVHKSQGSEYPVVVLPIVPGHYIMLQRNLLYTAVTRAKEKVILLGTQAALYTALSNDRTRRRYTLLAERLQGEALC